MKKLVSESLQEWQIINEMELASQKIAKAIEKDYKFNEAVAIITLGTILAAPAFIKVLGWLVKKGAGLFKWKKGEDAGKKLQEFAHKVEQKFLKPIIFVLTKMGVEKEKAGKWAKAIHSLIIVLLGIASGVGALHAAKAAHIGKVSLESMLMALKSGETGENIISYVQTAAEQFLTAGGDAVAEVGLEALDLGLEVGAGAAQVAAGATKS